MRAAISTALLLGLLGAQAQPAAASVAEEQKIGRRFAIEAAAFLPTIQDTTVVGLVREVGQRLVGTLGAQPFDYRFQVVASPDINAFAVPGGYIYVFSGLLAQAGSVDELASVLGHEVAHVHAHHAIRQQERTQLWNYAGLVGVLLSVVHPVLGAGAMGAAESARLKYSREFEEEADYMGLEFMRGAGYDTAATPVFFQRILTERRLNPAGVPPYLLTHPLTEDRITKVETALAKSPGPRRVPPESEVRRLKIAQALVRARTGAPEVVLAEYRRSSEADPKDGFGQYLLGIVYTEIGRLDSARTAFEQSQALGGAGERLPVRLGRVYLRLGRAAEARTMLQRYLAANRNDAEAYEIQGRVLLELGEDEAAIVEFQRSLALDPMHDESHWLLGQAQGRAGRSGEAFYHLGKATQLKGKLELAHSHYVKAREALPEDDPRAGEIDGLIKELGEILGARRQEARGRFRPVIP